jgi:hypothetical protein
MLPLDQPKTKKIKPREFKASTESTTATIHNTTMGASNGGLSLNAPQRTFNINLLNLSRYQGNLMAGIIRGKNNLSQNGIETLTSPSGFHLPSNTTGQIGALFLSHTIPHKIGSNQTTSKITIEARTVPPSQSTMTNQFLPVFTTLTPLQPDLRTILARPRPIPSHRSHLVPELRRGTFR